MRRTFVLGIGVVLVLGLAAGGCTHAPWNPYRGWGASKSANVTVYTDALMEHRFSQEWLEQSYSAYQAFFPNVPAKPVDVVFLHTDPQGLKRFYRPNDAPEAAWTVEALPSNGRIGRDGLIVL